MLPWLDKFYLDFQKFIFANNVLVAASAWCIGVATKEVIEKLLALVILPFVAWLKGMPGLRHVLQVTALTSLVEMMWTLVVWVLTIVLSFVLLEYFLNRTVFGMSSTIIKSEQKHDFIKARAQAKLDGVVSRTPEAAAEVREEKCADDRIVDKALREGTHNLDRIIQGEMLHLDSSLATTSQWW